MFAQHQPVRHDSLDEQLARLCPGENLTMEAMIAQNGHALENRQPGP